MTSRKFKPGEMGFRYDARGIVTDVEDGKQASELEVKFCSSKFRFRFFLTRNVPSDPR